MESTDVATITDEKEREIYRFLLVIMGLHKGRNMKLLKDRLSKFILFCGIFAPAMMMTIIIVLGYITPGYNPLREMVSQMGTPDRLYAIVLNSGYIVYGVLMGAAAYVIFQRIKIVTTKKLAILLGLHALGMTLLGVFPDSAVPFNMNQHLLHDGASVIAYVPLLVSTIIFPQIPLRGTALKVAAIVGLVATMINLPMPFLNILNIFRPIAGLLQRLLFAFIFSWLSYIFLLLYRKTNKNAWLTIPDKKRSGVGGKIQLDSPGVSRRDVKI